MTESDELVDAMRLLLTRHLEALATRKPAHMQAAVAGLLEALGSRWARAMPPPTAREALARRVLDKRVAEAEGALLHLDLALSGDASADVAVRLVTVERTCRALQHALAAWARAAGGSSTPPAVSAAACARLAREALVSGSPQAAALIAHRTLVLGLAEAVLGETPSEVGLEDALALWRDAEGGLPGERILSVATRLTASGFDDVGTWALIDEVESLVNEAGMSPLPARDHAVQAWRARGP